jgi:NAD(P)-dependent dehydrogenase (short-subunit alcohol dehydrogenase family)
MFRLDDRVAIVTGASSGLGEQFARALSAAGASVVVGARRADRLDALVAELGDGIAVQCDVTSAADRAALVECAMNRFGRVDVLVNNAGIAQSRPALDETIEDLRDVMDTNLTAAFALSCSVAPIMMSQGEGSIINVASLSWSRSLDRYALASYAASKGALVALTRELACQWGSTGVRVNSIAPAFFPSALSGWLEDKSLVAWIGQHTALGRPGRREELDGTLLYLAGGASSYVTGQVLVVDGGWTTY